MPTTVKPTRSFRDDARWNSHRMAVEFTLDVSGMQEFRCRVSIEALNDASGNSDSLSSDEALRLYRLYKARIHAAVDRKLKAGQFGNDHIILVRTADLARTQ